MFEELLLQIKHQYGKYLNFDYANSNGKESVYGMNSGFFEDETIVQFIPKAGGKYQIRHQYGKYLNFHCANSEKKEKVYGMKKDFHEDETIVYIIPKDDGYQIKHQYGKYLNFDNASKKYKERVYGMKKGFYEDETIVYLIPVNYNLIISIENFQYNTSALQSNSFSGEPYELINKEFVNKSNAKQVFQVRQTKTIRNSTTFQHSSKQVTKWINGISTKIAITADDVINLPIAEAGGKASIGYDFTWENETIKEFNLNTTQSVKHTLEIDETITVRPQRKMIYKNIAKKITGISIPFTATMKIKCEVNENYISNQALQFILNHIGNCPDGNMRVANGVGVYCIPFTGKIIPNVALDFSTSCKEFPL